MPEDLDPKQLRRARWGWGGAEVVPEAAGAELSELGGPDRAVNTRGLGDLERARGSFHEVLDPPKQVLVGASTDPDLKCDVWGS